MATLSGKTLGKVQVGDVIARGGMAEVYLGEHTTLTRKVAVKIMREHIEADPDNRARFEREARVVAGLRHPNIIQVFDYEILDGQPCLIMEYVPGASLGTYLKALNARGEKLPPQMVLRIISALASAIDYAHSQHIIHRDLKPANVLLRSASGPIDPNQPLPEDVEPILTDFGLVRLLDSTMHTSTGTVSGTPAYMSPEQAQGDKVDGKTDLYSLGVMLYEMLAGSVPFDAESSLGVLMKHINEAPRPIPGISSDLQAVINRALAKDAEARFPTAKALAREFESAFSGETISSDTLKLSKTAIKPPRGKTSARAFNWNFVFGGVILLAFVVIAYFFFSSPTNEPVGRAAYADFSQTMDKVTVFVTGLPAPESGKHYEAWLLSQGGETRRSIGAIEMDANGQGQLIFTNPNQKNLLAAFDQIEITLEPDNDPAPDESSGEIIASSVFPPFALIHVRHVLAFYSTAPDDVALIQGLWTATNGLNENVASLRDAYAKGDEALLRQKTEEIINQIVGSQEPLNYKDWDGNGTIADSSDGYGLLYNGEPGYTEQGYIAQVVSHAQFAAQSSDATENIQLHAGHISICADNMEGWTKQLLAKARQLQDLPFGADMEPLLAEMETLAQQILNGVDSNGNEQIEPIIGEGGAKTAYQHAYYLADMPLLIGAHQIPPPVATKAK